MSTHVVDLLDLLADLGPEPHAAVREESFPGDYGEVVLTRCRCGGLYGTRAITSHINDPAGSWQRMPPAYRALLGDPP